ncbi:MAG: flippase-like domain-containing protein, partial [Anaerolineales bacterium]
MKLRRWRGLIWLLALPALWWVVRSIPLEEIWSTLDHLALWQIGALVVLNLIILLLFTSRWWLVLRVLGYRLPLISLVGYRLAGFGISYFTPGPQFGGEPLQIQLTRQKHKVPTAAAVAAVSLDKLLELLTNFSFILIGAVVVLRSQIFSETLPLPLMGMAVAIFMLPAGYMLAIWLGR